MLKKTILLSIVAIASVTLYAQTRGNPSQIRVRVDANGSLVTAAAAQVAPVTSVRFSDARLAVDSSGNLLTVVSGGSGVGNLSGTLVSGRVPFADGVNSLTDIAGFTFATNTLTVPVLNGGTGTTSTLTLQSTSGVGTTGSDVVIKVGNNGATESARFYNTGSTSVGLPCTATGCNALGLFVAQYTTGTNGTAIVYDRFNAAAQGFILLGRHARGSISSPGQTVSGDSLINIIARGWESTTPAWTAANNAELRFVATENYTSTAQGTAVTFLTTPVGSVTPAANLSISPSGLVSAGSGLTVANVGANSCGTSPATIAGNVMAGEVTVGATSGTQCRVAVPQATTTRFNGSCNNQTTANLCRLVAVDTTHFDLLGTFVAGDVVAFVTISR